MSPGHPAPQLYRSVYDRLRASIIEGRLKPGERVPSARALATQLGLSRGTIDLAYAVLAGEGYLVSHGARGTFVSPALPTRAVTPPNRAKPPHAPAIPQPQAPLKLPFWVGLPAIDLFPRKIWSRLLAREGRGLSPEDFRYPNRSGDPRLKEALVSYLSVSRGIACTPDQIVITGGYQGAIGLVCRLLLTPGDKVWVEDPGYHWTLATLQTVGAQAIPVPVDHHGLDVAEGQARAPGAPLCIVTPSNQFPLGVALSLPRRLALLDWAAANGSWIVEDDYDSEFYYQGRLLPALKALDHADRVFYVGTFSKTLFPGLRLGYLVTPKPQAERFSRAHWSLDGGRSILEQITVADFITEGYFARHLKKMRGIYAARRAATVAALTKELGAIMSFDLSPGGLHVIGRLASAVDDVQLANRAIEAGYRPIALSMLSHRQPAQKGLLMGFTNVPEAQAPQLVRQFRKVLEV
jgi:GntR family transcriptional regulator / MocR family aminotransferase